MFDYMTDPTNIFYILNPRQDISLKTLYPIVGILLYPNHVQIFLYTKKRYSRLFYLLLLRSFVYLEHPVHVY